MSYRRNQKQIVCLLSLVCFISGVLSKRAYSTEELVFALGSPTNELVSTGNTGGAYSLASISNRDRNGNPCLGYSDPQPDNILKLQSDFASLTIEVSSSAKDTTLVIKSQETDAVLCAFGEDSNRDAIISANNWSAGTYYVWVGSISPNTRSPYRLSIKP